jgi:hypothetical protein
VGQGLWQVVQVFPPLKVQQVPLQCVRPQVDQRVGAGQWSGRYSPESVKPLMRAREHFLVSWDHHARAMPELFQHRHLSMHHLLLVNEWEGKPSPDLPSLDLKLGWRLAEIVHCAAPRNARQIGNSRCPTSRPVNGALRKEAD